jgi:predicted RNase H-like nuclease
MPAEIYEVNEVKTLLVGVDCATVDSKIGLALAEYNGSDVTLKAATLCGRERSAAKTVVEWLVHGRAPALIAIDAPLGWPTALARSLAHHRAGEKIDTKPNEMFRRATDRFIAKELSKTPLDVGADRIARTAHAALNLLSEIREHLGLSVPLAWSAECFGTSAIEVYPAATLVAHGFRSTRYKKPTQIEERREVLASLRTIIDVDEYALALESSADTLDAAVCVLAAKDFLDGRAIPPEDPESAAQEGWIWAPPFQLDVQPSNRKESTPNPPSLSQREL